MFQVLVKTIPRMTGSYSYLVEDREAAKALVARPDVWWYHFPAEDDDWDWRRGGAWTAPVEEAAAALEGSFTRNGPLPVAGAEQPCSRNDVKPQDGQDDDRW